LYGSGIRVGELISINRADLHDRSFTVIGKGGKVRLCFYDNRSEELINRYLSIREDNNPALFVTNGTRMTSGGVQEVFRQTAKRANLNKPITPHTMRHSFSTNFLRNNGNLRYLQELLGHSSLETTQMYTHVVNEDLRKMYTKYHSI
jgi:integrase/recombinase XerD